MLALVVRKYFWLVNGTFILLVALLLAGTANLFAEEAIAAPLPGTSASRAPARVASEEARTALDGARLGKRSSSTASPPLPPCLPCPR